MLMIGVVAADLRSAGRRKQPYVVVLGEIVLKFPAGVYIALTLSSDSLRAVQLGKLRVKAALLNLFSESHNIHSIVSFQTVFPK